MTATHSMRRTMWAAVAACFVAALITTAALVAGSGFVTVLAAVSALVVVPSLALLAFALAIIARRQRNVGEGRVDLFLAFNAPRSEAAILGGLHSFGSSRLRRSLARLAFGHDLLVGDTVRILPLEDIKKTLDADGTLDGLPFMDEMAALCGRGARVYRVLDRIYDYGRSRRMRRLDDAVLLVGLRCDGAAHGGCQAACYLIWKKQWLERIDPASRSVTEARTVSRTYTQAAMARREPRPEAAPSDVVYRCQYTQLARASQPLHGLQPAHILGALVVGNVTLRAFAVAALTRYANFAQTLRRGVCFPDRSEGDDAPLEQPASLHSGQRVRVRTPRQILDTLDRNSKHKGLWFDQDMLKHCGHVYSVLGRVERIIDVNSGRLVAMKTPCIVLDGVHYSGEFQWFGEQHDYLYWREHWLEVEDTERR